MVIDFYTWELSTYYKRDLENNVPPFLYYVVQLMVVQTIKWIAFSPPEIGKYKLAHPLSGLVNWGGLTRFQPASVWVSLVQPVTVPYWGGLGQVGRGGF